MVSFLRIETFPDGTGKGLPSVPVGVGGKDTRFAGGFGRGLLSPEAITIRITKDNQCQRVSPVE